MCKDKPARSSIDDILVRNEEEEQGVGQEDGVVHVEQDDSISTDSSAWEPVAETEDEARMFHPPLYVQRYNAVMNRLADPKWTKKLKKLVDFGCGDCKLLRRMKTLQYAMEVIGVDVDVDLLERGRRWTRPLFYDLLEPREHTELKMHLFQGSVSQKDKCIYSYRYT